ncbi:restriction endonuclease subunit S [Salmonella enterica]
MSGGKLPEGWVKTTIGVICEVKGGKRLPRGKALLNTATEHPYIRVTDFENGSVNLSTIKYLDSDTYSAIRNYTISKNDLYISIAGTIGLIGEIPEQLDNANLTENAAKLCSILGTDKKYLKYVLSSNKIIEQFDDKTTSSGQPKLALFRIRDCEFPYASINEQKIIAKKLDTLLAQVDSTKARLEQIPQILKRFRQAVLAAVVDGKSVDTNTDENTLTTLGNIAKNIKYGTSKKCSETQGSTAVLRIPNIGPGYIINSNLKYADFEQKELATLTLKEGDLLLIRSNGSVDLVGKVAVISENDTKYLYAGYLIRVRLNKDRAAPKYISYCLQSPQLRQVIENIARSTSGVNNINSKELASLEIPLPPLPEQHEIVRRVEQLFAYADTIEKQVNNALTRVNSLTQSILAKAFRGELTAQWRAENPDLISGENSAAALLEKIKAERAASGGKKTRVKKPDTYFKRT